MLELRTLISNQPFSGSVQPHQWNYFQYTTSASTAYVSLKEKSTEGLVWLYGNFYGNPDLRNYDYKDQDDKAFHSIEIDLSMTDQERTIIIGVYGSPFTARSVEYDVVAWSTPFKK